ncbi:translation initiation factor IF-2-like isoform X2 [Leguminivora glycinivorella]|uniref:translation initiation factor IF-2-like isoform X2 n=1 Tax=Leguminivora glycinivorella TaxID=1035111 RepID=UPI002010B417|nr:translation initiation factor IF-2-like isoform X2 [Leguminivora glycinivorella]
MARLTATECAPGPRARAPTPAPGTLDSKFPASTPGPAGVRSRGNGRTASGTGWAWRRGGGGCTAASGRRATRAGTAYARAPPATPSTRAPGPTGCRTDTALRLTLMAEHTKDNGCAACGTGTACGPPRPSGWRRTTAAARGTTGGPCPRWPRRARPTPPSAARIAWTRRAAASSSRATPTNPPAAAGPSSKNRRKDYSLTNIWKLVSQKRTWANGRTTNAMHSE